MRMTLIALSLLAGTFALGACNTVDGIGQDLERAGEEVQSW